jgi:hypothetical protein
MRGGEAMKRSKKGSKKVGLTRKEFLISAGAAGVVVAATGLTHGASAQQAEAAGNSDKLMTSNWCQANGCAAQ